MVYLDNNATTPVDPLVAEAMSEVLKEHFGNPSSLYPAGRRVKELVNEARERVAGALGAQRGEIYFTGSGTEADNFAVFGTLEASRGKDEFVTSAIEHPAVLESAKFLERKGIKVTYVPVDGQGTIDLDFLRSSLTPRTALVSVMYANNEIGTIQPVKDIVQACHERGIPVHTDAVQAFGKIDVDVDKLGVDLLTVSAHKIYGPKGVGALFIRRGTNLVPFIHGGRQEKETGNGHQGRNGARARERIHCGPPGSVRSRPGISQLRRGMEMAGNREFKGNKDWCERGELNPHPRRDWILSPARLPVPPRSHAGGTVGPGGREGQA